MNINRENYEAFFIDYLDGILSEAGIVELEAFLLENPDLREELEGMEKIFLAPTDESFSLKENLKQVDLSSPVEEGNFEFYCIAESEGDLTPDQVAELEKFVAQNPSRQKERDLIHRLKITPDPSIKFSDKERIKKSIFLISRPLIYRGIGVAAGIAIMLFVYFGFIQQNVNNSFSGGANIISENKDTTAVSTADQEKDIPEEKDENKKSIIPVRKETIKRAASKITFKVGPPIASNEMNPTEIPEKSEVFDNYAIEPEIDPGMLASQLVFTPVAADIINPSKIGVNRVKKPADPQDYLAVNEFVKQKFTEMIFKQKEEELTIWNLASAGVTKLSDVTGAKMSLEASADSEGKPKRLNFNSRVLSFSTPINREE